MQRQEAQRVASFGDDFATAGAATLYDGRLEDQSVSILTLPGADADVVSGLAAQVERAGGTVAGTYDAQPVLVDASEKSLVDTMGSQLMTTLGDDAVSADASTYPRLGQLLGLALGGARGIAGGRHVDPAEPGRRRPAELARRRAARVRWCWWCSGTTSTTRSSPGCCPAWPRRRPASSSPATPPPGWTGTCTRCAGSRSPTTSPPSTASTPCVGQVTAVLALARSLEVPGGSFGASGSDGAVPLG